MSIQSISSTTSGSNPYVNQTNPQIVALQKKISAEQLSKDTAEVKAEKIQALKLKMKQLQNQAEVQ
jgi:hypothetical protein